MADHLIKAQLAEGLGEVHIKLSIERWNMRSLGADRFLASALASKIRSLSDQTSPPIALRFEFQAGKTPMTFQSQGQGPFRPRKKEIANNTRNITNSIQAMLLAAPATPERPSMPATIATIKNIKAQDNIVLSPPSNHPASIRRIRFVCLHHGFS